MQTKQQQANNIINASKNEAKPLSGAASN